MQRRTRRTVGILGIIAFLLLLLLAWQCLIINPSSSMPMGLYLKTGNGAVHKGDDVMVCLPAGYQISKELTDNGQCPDGKQALLKRVIGVPGDNITVSNQAVVVDGRSYVSPLFDVSPHDGKTLERLTKNGNYTLTGYWLYGAGNPEYSWDSRYFGEVKRGEIMAQVMPLLTRNNDSGTENYLPHFLISLASLLALALVFSCVCYLLLRFMLFAFFAPTNRAKRFVLRHQRIAVIVIFLVGLALAARLNLSHAISLWLFY